jgi:hypothetical protein
MQDRDVTIQVRMKASQVEETRRKFAVPEEFPAYAGHYANDNEKLMLSDDPKPEDGAELAGLIARLKADCVAADQIVKQLKPLIAGATISDPDGRGRLQ